MAVISFWDVAWVAGGALVTILIASAIGVWAVQETGTLQRKREVERIRRLAEGVRAPASATDHPPPPPAANGDEDAELR